MARTKTMLSCEVCGSDKFLDLTFEAQALYFHILMNADGMGAFDAARSLLRQVGSRAGGVGRTRSGGLRCPCRLRNGRSVFRSALVGAQQT